jgi:hypothetical protein
MAGQAMQNGESVMTDAGHKVNIKFVYNYCSSIDAMRFFYTELIGLNETSYQNDPDWKWLVYKCGGFEFMFFEAPGLSAASEFSEQPGWDGGTLPRVSWSIEVPEADFADAVARLSAAEGVRCFADKPVWAQDSYWSFPVLDPMGNTAEIYSMVKERPASTEWGEPA